MKRPLPLADISVILILAGVAILLIALIAGCATDGAQRTLQTLEVGYEKSDGDTRGVFSNDYDTYTVSINPLAGLETDRERLERLSVWKLEHEGVIAPIPPPDPQAPVPTQTDWSVLGTAIGTLAAALVAVFQRERITKLVRRKSGKES